MGYSYSNYDSPIMCFNNAKSWQSGWFSDATHQVNVNENWTGDIQGQVSYDPNGGPGQLPVVVKINTNTADDFFVGFNWRTSHNSGTQEAANQVTIQKQGGEGTANGNESDLLAKMNAGGSYQGADSGSIPFTVTVNTINTSTGRANISIVYGNTCTVTADCGAFDFGCFETECLAGVCQAGNVSQCLLVHLSIRSYREWS